MSTTHHHLFQDPPSPAQLRSLRGTTSTPTRPTSGSSFVPPGSQRTSKGVRLARLTPDLTQRRHQADEESPLAPHKMARPDSVPFAPPDLDASAKHKLFASLPVPKSNWGVNSRSVGSSVPRVRAIRAGECLEPLDRDKMFAGLGGSGPVPLMREKKAPLLGAGLVRSVDDTTTASRRHTVDEGDGSRKLLEAQRRIDELSQELRRQRGGLAVAAATNVVCRKNIVLRAAGREDRHICRTVLLAWRNEALLERRRDFSIREASVLEQYKSVRGLVESQAERLSAVRERGLRGGSAWADSVSRSVTLKLFAAWKSAAQNRRSCGALQAQLFAETAYRTAALDAQKREMEVRSLEKEARQREALYRLNADLASSRARPMDSSSAAGQEAAGPDSDLAEALRAAFREASQAARDSPRNASPAESSALPSSEPAVGESQGSQAAVDSGAESGRRESDVDSRVALIIETLQGHAEAQFAEHVRFHAQRSAQLLADAEKQHMEALRYVQDISEQRVCEAELQHNENMRDLQWACEQKYYELEARHARALQALQGALEEEFVYNDEDLNVTY